MVEKIVLEDGTEFDVRLTGMWYYNNRSNRQISFTNVPYEPNIGLLFKRDPQIGMYPSEVEGGFKNLKVIKSYYSKISSLT